MHQLIKATLFISLFISLGSCHKRVFEKDLKNLNSQEIKAQTDKDDLNKNVFITSENEAQTGTTIKENHLKYDPINVVDDLLANPTKNIHIALVVPTSGQYAGVGNMILESAMMTMSKSGYQNAGQINVYNIGKLNSKTWQEDKEIIRLKKDNNDIVIGSVFKDTTKKIMSILPEDVQVISFINDDDMAKKYPNLTIVSMNDGFKIVSLLKYLQDNKRQFLSLMLPATKKGYAEEKLFRKLAPRYQIFITNSQFYQENNKTSIRASARELNKSFTATYMIDENGQFYTETYKQNKEKQKQNKQKGQELQSITEQSTTIAKTQQVETNAIYIGGEEWSLNLALSFLQQLGILDKDVQVFSNAVIALNQISTTKLDSVMYIGYNYNYVDGFNKQFNEYFGHQPNYYAYLTHDILSMIIYVANIGEMLPRSLYHPDGFRGVLDEFRFTREGNIERRFGLYNLTNETALRSFVPDDYISLADATGKNDEYYK